MQNQNNSSCYHIFVEDAPIDPGDARIAIIGMSRVGAGAYDTLKAKYGDVLIGFDADPDVVTQHESAGRNVILADATDDEFWARVQAGKVTVALLAMPEFEQNLGVAQRIQQNYADLGPDYSVADNPEQAQALQTAGVNAVWNFDTEAGKGFAEEVIFGSLSLKCASSKIQYETPIYLKQQREEQK